MGVVIPFPIRRSEAEDLAIDLPFISGNMFGVHLTEWHEIAFFVEHEGDAIGGLLTVQQVVELRSQLGAMLDKAFGGSSPKGAA